MKRLLITGFEPFGGETINPAWESVKALPDTLGNYTLYKREIPVLFGGAPGRVLEAAAEISPDGILCIGQAGGREAVTPERIAVNIRDAGIPDNGGMRPEGQRILEAGDAAYFATVPVEAMADAIRRAGLPGRVSNSAGTFVCNDTLYTLLHHFQGSAVRVGFIHVPYLPEQGSPSLTLADTIKALEAAILALDTSM